MAGLRRNQTTDTQCMAQRQRVQSRGRGKSKGIRSEEQKSSGTTPRSFCEPSDFVITFTRLGSGPRLSVVYARESVQVASSTVRVSAAQRRLVRSPWVDAIFRCNFFLLRPREKCASSPSVLVGSGRLLWLFVARYICCSSRNQLFLSGQLSRIVPNRLIVPVDKLDTHSAASGRTGPFKNLFLFFSPCSVNL